MQAAVELPGYTLESDDLPRQIPRKRKEIASTTRNFDEGAVKQGIPGKKPNHI
jgi:DNA polymerase III alpha subunit